MEDSRPGCLAYGLFVLALLWAGVVLALSAPAVWFLRDVLTVSGVVWPFWADPVAALAQALLILLLVGPLAFLTKAPHLRAAYRSWAVAAGVLVLFGLARVLPLAGQQLTVAIQAGLGLLSAAVIGFALRPQAAPEPGQKMLWPLAFAAGLLAVGPWAVLGALGSPLDTLLALVAGLSVGLLGGLLLDRMILPGLRTWQAGPTALVGFGGLVLGMALLIIAAGTGWGATNLLLMAALPALGIAATAVAGSDGGRRAWIGPSLLIGVAAFAALAFFDPEEITIILGGSDVPTLAASAAGWAVAAGLLLSGLLWLASPLLSNVGRPVAFASLGVAALVAAGLYIGPGRPGFYGEQLFVILRDQADLSAAPNIAVREDRLRFVYQTLAEHAATTQAGLRDDLDGLGISYTPYYLINALEVEGGPLLRLWLAGRPEVERVIDSPRLRPLPVPPPPEPGLAAPPDAPLWNVQLIEADRVWTELGVTGAGIVIGQSDSGVDWNHPALRDSYRGNAGEHSYNWLDPWYGTAEPRDYGMHGTHTLGSALGDGGIGVAPDATWFACSNLARNLGNPARYLDCLQFMLAPYVAGANPFEAGDPGRAAHVLNNSWGCPPLEGCDPRSLEPAVEALRAAGIFVVASAGNDGPTCSSLNAPIAIYDASFTVGAVDETGALADFSSRGPVTADGSDRSKPDIAAPGVNILSAQPGGGYGFADGTSMAGPHVAGVVALIWSANPDLIGDIERTEQILRETAQPYNGAAIGCGGEGNLVGAGIVDAYAAVRAALGE